jgi:hypothetical protein
MEASSNGLVIRFDWYKSYPSGLMELGITLPAHNIIVPSQRRYTIPINRAKAFGKSKQPELHQRLTGC